MTRYDSLRTYVDEARATRDAAHERRMETLNAVYGTGRAFVIAALILFFFNTAGLRTWTSDLPGNVTVDRLASEAENWHDLMQRVGFAAPKAWLGEKLMGWREMSWSELSSGQFVEVSDETNFADDMTELRDHDLNGARGAGDVFDAQEGDTDVFHSE